MRSRSEFERIKAALERADVEGPLTASEIVDVLEDHGVDVDSPHRVATILGRRSERGEVEIVDATPYRYRV